MIKCEVGDFLICSKTCNSSIDNVYEGIIYKITGLDLDGHAILHTDKDLSMGWNVQKNFILFKHNPTKLEMLIYGVE